MRTATAAVQTDDRVIELQELRLPDRLEPGQALLRVEASGMCATDYEVYAGHFTALVTYPFVPGHEPLGVIEVLTPEAEARWGLKVGDRVVVEGIVSCRMCDRCVEGDYVLCANRFQYGHESTAIGSGLWGGYAEYMVLQPSSILHRVSPRLSTETAVLFNPLGGGFEWTLGTGGLRTGETVLILGPGQRGTACAVAAATVGASRVIVTGVEADAKKLELVKEFGATDIVNVSETDIVEWVAEETKGRGVDLVIDTVPYATSVIQDTISTARRGGRIVLAGVKSPHKIDNFPSDSLILKNLTMKGAFAVKSRAFEQAIEILERGAFPFEKLHSHTLPISQLEYGLQLLSGETSDGSVVTHVTITPE